MLECYNLWRCHNRKELHSGAAGAVVNRDIPDNCIAAGVPARVLRKLDEQDRMNVWDTYMKNEVPLSQRERER
ncbi:acyltransferase [Agathobacter rectalis]|uniref:acyltransferase n=1 Tax=Agathobacter rectalis TaxID=39491 RepID=UPI0012D7D832|nr:hypothetical protein [Agathobacter rectalis]